MPTADFFKQYGLYTKRRFLDRGFCLDVIGEMKKAKADFGTITAKSANEIVDKSVKSRMEMEAVSPSLIERLKKEFRVALPSLEDFYSVELRDVQPPKFIEYREGDFYKPHTDLMDDLGGFAVDGKDSPKYRGIIFLNDESEEPFEDAYCGGHLTFHGLMGNSAFANFGLPLIGESGLLVTFPPDVLHEVTAVTKGNRYSVATWFV